MNRAFKLAQAARKKKDDKKRALDMIVKTEIILDDPHTKYGKYLKVRHLGETEYNDQIPERNFFWGKFNTLLKEYSEHLQSKYPEVFKEEE